METLALAASNLQKIMNPVMQVEIDPLLVKIFSIEYHKFHSVIALLSGNERYRNQRMALEVVKPALDDVAKQIAPQNQDLQFYGTLPVSNGNLVWYIQKMVELRTTAIQWAQKNGLIH